MATEIERKFLVDVKHPDLISILSNPGRYIAQGYLCSDPERVVRVRINQNDGFLTIKGKQHGISKAEYEYPIPASDAMSMLAMCETKVTKVRHIVPNGNLFWEIDVFSGDNTGLVVAEIELPSEECVFAVPEWVLDDVSTDYRYSNVNLAVKPYLTW